MRSLLRLIAWSATLALVLLPASRPSGPVPALGPFLDPVHGVWSVAYSAELPESSSATTPGLLDSVRVVYDDRRVPHIFASTTSDLYRALGYVVARDRLFQMEMQTRATAGTLSEVAGEALVEIDMQVRRLGLAEAARRDFDRLEEADPELADAMRSYADGVNAFIAGLSRGEKPFEYHLLGADPAPWEPVHTFYLLKRMGWILAFAPVELMKERVASRVGPEAADALFPVDAPIREPIVPHRGARWVGGHVPPPLIMEPVTASGSDRLPGLVQLPGPDAFAGFRSGSSSPPLESNSSALGSNSWAVAASRSASRAPILAGDPHLSLSLPSIWYEAHLVVPGELDVYGVTLAGVPGIVIGFNRDVAWTFTNTGADVLDYYREQLDDSVAPAHYLLDGEWTPLAARVEHFRGRDGAVIRSDTVRSTHRGPLLEIDGEAMSMRWTVLEGQRELRSLLDAGRARTVDEWLDAMSGWHAPAQNGLVAGRDGNIAVQSAGYFPLRPAGARGDRVQDGASRASDWLGRTARVPIAKNPSQGYLASANQQPYDPESEPAYLGADWPEPWRALTINELLRAKERHSAAELAAYQTYPTSIRARTFRAVFLTVVDQVAERGRVAPDVAEAARLLEEWNGRYDLANQRTVLFERAMDALEDGLWDELADPGPDGGSPDGRGARAVTPGEDILWLLVGQPDSPWWDDRRTPVVEHRDAVVARALATAMEQLRNEHGREDGDGWAWRNFGRHNIHHLLRMPALSRLNLPTASGPGLLNPMSGTGTHGASWRMVVELGDQVLARGTYPGGQSGNPASRDYDDRLAHWVAGELEDLRFPHSEAELRDAGLVRAQLVLAPPSSPFSTHPREKPEP